MTVATNSDHIPQRNPRLQILHAEVDQNVLKPFRSHGWNAQVVRETDGWDSIEVAASKVSETVRLAILYSCGIPSDAYLDLAQRCQYIFYLGQPGTGQATIDRSPIPLETIGRFFPLLVKLNKRIEPDQSKDVSFRRIVSVRRLTAENPIEAVLTRLQQFTSVHLASKLVERRCASEGGHSYAGDNSNKSYRCGVLHAQRIGLSDVASH